VWAGDDKQKKEEETKVLKRLKELAIAAEEKYDDEDSEVESKDKEGNP